MHTAITPVRLAVGITSIKGDATNIKTSIIIPATIPDKRNQPFAPFVQLITLGPIVAPPPIVPNIPDTKFLSFDFVSYCQYIKTSW